MPRYSEIAWPPVSTAMSCSMALRRSPKTRSLDGRDLQTAAQTVDDQGGESFAFDVLRNNDKRLAALNDGFQQGKQFVQLRTASFR